MVMGIKQFQRLFHKTANISIDKSDVKRLSDFIGNRLRDLLVLGQASASVNGRDIIDYQDIPITAGLQQSIRDFRALDEEISLAPILEQQATLPPLKLGLSDMTEKKIPEIVGGITVSLARVFRTVYPDLKNPGSEEWERVEEIYRILL